MVVARGCSRAQQWRKPHPLILILANGQPSVCQDSFKYEVITMLENSAFRRITILISGFLLASLMTSTACAQSSPNSNQSKAVPASAQTKLVRTSAPTRYQPNPYAGRAGRFYALFWGIDSPTVKAVESGELIRFTYHVLDPDRAKAINEKAGKTYWMAFSNPGRRVKRGDRVNVVIGHFQAEGLVVE
jgi:hypothetical protein